MYIEIKNFTGEHTTELVIEARKCYVKIFDGSYLLYPTQRDCHDAFYTLTKEEYMRVKKILLKLQKIKLHT